MQDKYKKFKMISFSSEQFYELISQLDVIKSGFAQLKKDMKAKEQSAESKTPERKGSSSRQKKTTKDDYEEDSDHEINRSRSKRQKKSRYQHHSEDDDRSHRSRSSTPDFD